MSERKTLPGYRLALFATALAVCIQTNPWTQL